MNNRELISTVNGVAADLAALGQVMQWLSQNRELLALQLRAGAIHNAREMVREFLQDNPGAAGIVNYWMTQDVDAAIGAVSLYDPTLAQALSECRHNFAALQQSWSLESGVRSQ